MIKILLAALSIFERLNILSPIIGIFTGVTRFKDCNLQNEKIWDISCAVCLNSSGVEFDQKLKHVKKCREVGRSSIEKSKLPLLFSGHISFIFNLIKKNNTPPSAVLGDKKFDEFFSFYESTLKPEIAEKVRLLCDMSGQILAANIFKDFVSLYGPISYFSHKDRHKLKRFEEQNLSQFSILSSENIVVYLTNRATYEEHVGNLEHKLINEECNKIISQCLEKKLFEFSNQNNIFNVKIKFDNNTEPCNISINEVHYAMKLQRVINAVSIYESPDELQDSQFRRAVEKILIAGWMWNEAKKIGVKIDDKYCRCLFEFAEGLQTIARESTGSKVLVVSVWMASESVINELIHMLRKGAPHSFIEPYFEDRVVRKINLPLKDGIVYKDIYGGIIKPKEGDLIYFADNGEFMIGRVTGDIKEYKSIDNIVSAIDSYQLPEISSY